MKHWVERLFLFAGFCWLAGCTESPAHHSLGLAISDTSSCSSSCDDARTSCRDACHDTDCAADCETNWEHCRLDCPDGSIDSANAVPVGTIGASQTPSGVSTANTPGLPSNPIDGGAADGGGLGSAGAGGINGINLTNSAGINGIDVANSGGINGISIASGGTGF